jgi:hypothetical protein
MDISAALNMGTMVENAVLAQPRVMASYISTCCSGLDGGEGLAKAQEQMIDFENIMTLGSLQNVP